MLVLSRKLGQSVYIENFIRISIVENDGKNVRLAFDAPKQIHIMREEKLSQHIIDRFFELYSQRKNSFKS
jgi:carbon storage regulator